MNRRAFKIVSSVLAMCLVIVFCGAFTNPEKELQPVRTARQELLHELAEQAREAGEPEDGPVIKMLQEEWWKEQEDLSILAKTIYHEAGNCTWEHRVYVGAVVLNRVASPLFPDTVYEVVAQPGQYLKSYCSGFNNIPRGSWEAAKAAMDGDHDMPTDVYWQANFPQGKTTWKVIDSGYSLTYFGQGFSWE